MEIRMTRLLYLPDDVTVIQLEVELTPAQLSAAVNAGMRPLEVLRSAPPGKLIAHQIGSTVIVSPAPKRISRSTLPAKSNLSRRQAQVLELSARGLSSGEIALLLRLSRRTVNYHLAKVKDRVRVISSISTVVPLKSEDR
jgi:DNA-binding CsgD family transcriptional regulator